MMTVRNSTLSFRAPRWFSAGLGSTFRDKTFGTLGSRWITRPYRIIPPVFKLPRLGPVIPVGFRARRPPRVVSRPRSGAYEF